MSYLRRLHVEEISQNPPVSYRSHFLFIDPSVKKHINCLSPLQDSESLQFFIPEPYPALSIYTTQTRLLIATRTSDDDEEIVYEDLSVPSFLFESEDENEDEDEDEESDEEHQKKEFEDGGHREREDLEESVNQNSKRVKNEPDPSSPKKRQKSVVEGPEKGDENSKLVKKEPESPKERQESIFEGPRKEDGTSKQLKKEANSPKKRQKSEPDSPQERQASVVEGPQKGGEDWPWRISKTGLQYLEDVFTAGDNTDPQAQGMWVYNDFHGYGLTEMMEN
ncbi:hypothetical protein RUND412_008692 [Rhizina undulata]